MSACEINVRQEAKHSYRRRDSQGFTLIELLVIVAIIGVLASIAIPMYSDYVDKARLTVAVSTLDTMRKDLEAFHIDNQEYPQEIDFVSGLENPGPGRRVFSAVLIEQIANDFSTLPIYNATTLDSYTITTSAKDKVGTPMELTPQEITY